MKKFAAFLETGRSAAHMLDEHNPVVSSLEVKTSFFADVLDVLKNFSFFSCVLEECCAVWWMMMMIHSICHRAGV